MVHRSWRKTARAAALAAVWAAALAAGNASAAKGKPKKVSELLREANTLMSRAQDTYVNGDSRDAIALYRKSLEEIRRVERENPERIGTPEFAPVKFRRALCEAEIDRIILEEANATARTLTVSDTAELEKKRAARKKEAREKHIPEAAVPLSSKRADGRAVEKEKPSPAGKDGPGEDSGADAGKPVDIADELEFAKDMLSIDRLQDARRSLRKILKNDPDHREGRFLMAILQLREGRPADASMVLDDLLADFPSDEAALLLAAGARFSEGLYSKAMDFLDKAMRVNPKRPDGYYNMAWMLLEMNPNDPADPERYYRQAVKLGGPRDRDLERRLGIKER